MNIYALEGHKVKVYTFDAGYDYDKNVAIEHLELNKDYTVDYTIVHSWSTEVFLKEIPKISFNSVFFEDVTEQSEEENMKHSDWAYYNEEGYGELD